MYPSSNKSLIDPETSKPNFAEVRRRVRADLLEGFTRRNEINTASVIETYAQTPELAAHRGYVVGMANKWVLYFYFLFFFFSMFGLGLVGLRAMDVYAAQCGDDSYIGHTRIADSVS